MNPTKPGEKPKTWQKRDHEYLKDWAQDIKFGPKHLGLVLAVALANGTVNIYKWQSDNIHANKSEIASINVIAGHGECTCLSWNPTFDEPMSLVVGCLITSSPEVFNERKSANEGKGEENEKETELQSQEHQQQNQLSVDANLLQLVIMEHADAKNLKLVPMNGNMNLAKAAEYCNGHE